MSFTVAEGVVEVTADADGVPRAVATSIDGGSGLVSAAGGRSGAGFLAGFKAPLVAGAIAALALGVATQVGRAVQDGLRAGATYVIDSVGLASDLSETQSAITQVFDTSTESMLTWASTANTSLGQTQQQALDGARTFGVLGSQLGLTDDERATFSIGLTELATDLASFNNRPVDEAILALGAGLRGEAEPLRSFGIMLDDATLKARALEMGIWDGTGALDQQQRMMAANAEIFAQAGPEVTNQLGDFERTSEGLANQQRMLSAAFQEAQTSLGTALLPAVTELVTFANTNLIPILNDVVDEVGPVLSEALVESTPALIELAEVFADMLPDLVELGLNILPIMVDLFILGAPLLKDWAASTGSFFDILNAMLGWLSGDTTLADFVDVIDLADGSTWELSRTIRDALLTAQRFFLDFGINVRNTITGFLGMIRDIPGNIRDALSGAGSWLVQTGRDIIQGLINGVGGMIDAAVRSVTRVGGAMLDGIKDFLGIRSPSIRMDLEVGEMMGEGVIQGWQRKLSDWRTGLSADLDVPVRQLTSTPAALAATPEGGYVINIGTISIPADTIDDFVRLIELIKALPQVARTGKGALA